MTRTRTRSAGMLLVTLLLATLVAGPVAARGPLAPAAMPRERAADVAPALRADGTFRGAPGIAGTVDTSAWTLVSDLAAGAPPRFAPAGVAVATPIGPWSALGSNGSGKGALNGVVYAIAVSGSDLYVGGEFTDAAGIPEADNIAMWNGSAWSALGSNGSGNGALDYWVGALAVSGSDLYVGGGFTNAAGIPEADYVAQWNGSAWSALGGDGDGALNGGGVYALAISGTDVIVGGGFTNARGIPEADHVAMWSGGNHWSALGSNGSGDGAVTGIVYALAVSGTDLYVGGNFIDAAGIPEADNVAKWDGSAWSALGSNGFGNGAIEEVPNIDFQPVVALAVSGADLYVGGGFTDAAGIPEADHVARWDGSAWSALGSNGSGDGALNGLVYHFAVSGGDLYVGGIFINVAGVLPAADYIAKWNGSAWSALGSNGSGNGALTGGVTVLTASGTSLYVGGGFTNAAGIATADYIAKWTIDNVPPDTTITGGPSGTVASTSAIFTFDSTEAGSTFQCSLDGAAFSACSSPWAYVSLNKGAHSFAVKAADLAGNVDPTPASRAWTVGVVVRKPDGRIRLGTTGAFVGDNIYNTTGAGQSKTGSAVRGHSVTFGISIQNDGTVTDSFKVKATGTAASAYTVKYLHGITDITAAVVAGTYQTPSLAPAATYLITAKVTVKSTAAVGSNVTRLVTISSAGSSAKKDAVKLVAKRA